MLKAPQSVFCTPRGRDVLVYTDKAIFYNPGEGSSGPRAEADAAKDQESLGCPEMASHHVVAPSAQ